MLPNEFVIKNVDVWNSNKLELGVDVYIVSSVVEKIIPHSSSNSYPDIVIEGNGAALIPSGVDLQVHIRTPGQYHKENPITAARAALRGGYAALLAMPNTFPVVDNVPVLRRCLQEYSVATAQLGVEIFQSSAMSIALKGREAVDFAAMKEAGAVALTDDGIPLVNDELMLAAFKASAELKIPVLQHAEWPGHGGSLSKGATQTKLGLVEYPRDAESRCVQRDINLLKQVPGAHYHVLHVTTKRSVEFIEKAKSDGLNITAEVSPHHLYFCADDIPENNTNFKMNPPLFTDEDRSALRDALNRGVFDFVATDHAPHEAYGKSKGFQEAPFGTTGLETCLRVLLEMLDLGVIKSPEQLVELFSTAPARAIRLSSREGWGEVKVGAPFRAALWDAKASKAEIQVFELESLSKNNIFLGAALPGKIKAHFTPCGYFAF